MDTFTGRPARRLRVQRQRDADHARQGRVRAVVPGLRERSTSRARPSAPASCTPPASRTSTRTPRPCWSISRPRPVKSSFGDQKQYLRWSGAAGQGRRRLARSTSFEDGSVMAVRDLVRPPRRRARRHPGRDPGRLARGHRPRGAGHQPVPSTTRRPRCCSTRRRGRRTTPTLAASEPAPEAEPGAASPTRRAGRDRRIRGDHHRLDARRAPLGGRCWPRPGSRSPSPW